MLLLVMRRQFAGIPRSPALKRLRGAASLRPFRLFSDKTAAIKEFGAYLSTRLSYLVMMGAGPMPSATAA